jgi:hypothetical protein
MDRTRFYVEETVNEIKELDFIHNNVSKFTMRYEPGYYRVDESDIMRPDMISYKNYGTVRYWWLICYVNEIEDPLTTLSVGLLLRIPNLLDIYDFYKKYKVR